MKRWNSWYQRYDWSLKQDWAMIGQILWLRVRAFTGPTTWLCPFSIPLCPFHLLPQPLCTWRWVLFLLIPFCYCISTTHKSRLRSLREALNTLHCSQRCLLTCVRRSMLRDECVYRLVKQISGALLKWTQSNVWGEINKRRAEDDLKSILRSHNIRRQIREAHRSITPDDKWLTRHHWG